MPSACSQELAGLADVPLEFGGRIPLAHCPVRPVSSATALAMGGHAICNAASHHLLSNHSDTGCTFCLSSEFRSSSFGLEPIDTVQLHNAFRKFGACQTLERQESGIKSIYRRSNRSKLSIDNLHMFQPKPMFQLSTGIYVMAVTGAIES